MGGYTSQLAEREGRLPGNTSPQSIPFSIDVIKVEAQVAPEDAWLGFLQARPGLSMSRVIYTMAGKRLLDVIGASTLLVVLSPLYLIISLAILIESGRPIVFRQTRVGAGGRPFTMLKFRTMIADRRKRRGPYRGPERRRRHKSERDPRVTGIGRLLRKTSLDELPQIVNVLRGEMSFIGPRPELPQIVDRYDGWQHERHLVRPGLSGWWQINGRSDRPMHENTELDIYYVRNCAFMLDLQIFVRTFGAVFNRRGAF